MTDHGDHEYLLLLRQAVNGTLRVNGPHWHGYESLTRQRDALSRAIERAKPPVEQVPSAIFQKAGPEAVALRKREMNPDKLSWLCANMFRVGIDANDHRTSALSVAQAFDQQPEVYDDMEPEVKAECVRRGQLVSVYVYPSNSVGSYAWHHYDATRAVHEAYEFLLQRSERYDP